MLILISTDLTELDLPSTMKTEFPDPADLLNFTLTITPDEGVSHLAREILMAVLFDVIGMYRGGAFQFSFAINTNYPHDPPKVKCTQKVRPKPVPYAETLHPLYSGSNIDTQYSCTV